MPGYAESAADGTACAKNNTLGCTVKGAGEPLVIVCDPNTSLYSTNVRLPAVRYAIPAGHSEIKTEVSDCVFDA